MTLGVLTKPDPLFVEINNRLTWSRLRAEHVDSYQFIRESKEMFRKGLDDRQAAQLLYQIGGVINVARIYQHPQDRFAIRNFALASAYTWFDTDFKPYKPMTPDTIGKFYASFAHFGARLPKKAHQIMRDKIRANQDAFSSADGTRIMEYYAATADHMSPSIFEITVKAVERGSYHLMASRETGFLKYLALIDSMYEEKHFTKRYEPRVVFSRIMDKFVEKNIEVTVGATETAKQWFEGKPMPLTSNGLSHITHVQETADRLKSIGLKLYSDFNSVAAETQLTGVDFAVGTDVTDKRVGIIHDTAVKYIEGDTFPRVLYPNGRTIFNSAAIQKLYPDQVVVRLSTIAMNRFSNEQIGQAFDMAFQKPANVYGLNENAQLQPIRKLSFKS